MQRTTHRGPETVLDQGPASLPSFSPLPGSGRRSAQRIVERPAKVAWVGAGPHDVDRAWPRVSVIVPCYNYSRWLRECVASVFAQGVNDLEVIIVDDASTDDSLAVAKDLAARDHRVTVIANSRNKGHIPSVNLALAAATGDYILKLDADDLLPRGSLGRSLTVLESNPRVGFVYGRCLSFGSDLKRITPWSQRLTRRSGLLMSDETANVHFSQDTFPYRVWAGRDWLKLRCERGVNCISQPEVLIRSSVLRDVGAYDEALPHTSDLAMWLELSARADVAYIDGPVQGLYRVHKSSMQRTVNAGKFRDLSGRLEAFDSALSRARHLVPDATDLALVARKTLAVEALDEACRAFERRLERKESIEQYERLAVTIYPEATLLPEWLTLQTRRSPRTGPWRLAWLAATLKRRLREERNWRRWWRSGI